MAWGILNNICRFCFPGFFSSILPFLVHLLDFSLKGAVVVLGRDATIWLVVQFRGLGGAVQLGGGRGMRNGCKLWIR